MRISQKMNKADGSIASWTGFKRTKGRRLDENPRFLTPDLAQLSICKISFAHINFVSFIT